MSIALDDVAVGLDIDATVDRLTLRGSATQLRATDHRLAVLGRTKIKPDDRIDVVADALPEVVCDLGTLKNFSGTELLSGGFFVTAAPGTRSTLRFQGANIVTNSGRLGLIGPGASIVDENGADALAGFTTNGAGGFVRFADGYSFTTNRDFTNDGYLVVRPGSTATFHGSFTDVLGQGEDDGLIEVFGTDDPSAGIHAGDGRLITTGAFSAYDPATHTLADGQYGPTASGHGSATIQINDADVVTNDAILLILGQNATLIDQHGTDALRNLAVNHGLLEFDRQTRGTAGDFLNASADGYGFYVTGGSHFTVAGNLTNDSPLVISPYDNAQNITIVPGFPASDDGALPADVTVLGNATLTAQSEVDLEVYSPAITAALNVRGKATLAGKLTVNFTYDDSLINGADTLTLIQTRSAKEPASLTLPVVSLDGRMFADCGEACKAVARNFRGDMIGAFTYNNRDEVTNR